MSSENPIWVSFARNIGPVMQLPAGLLARQLGGGRKQPLRVLDMAAGHGLFGIAIAKRFPNAKVTAVDWQNVLEVAAENAKREDVEGQMVFRPGSTFDVDWGGPYDVVIFSNFFHHFDLEQCLNLAVQAHSVLSPGGRVLTLEYMLDEDQAYTPEAVTFALAMLATTTVGGAHTFGSYEKVFSQAGFEKTLLLPKMPGNQQAILTFKR